MQHLATKATIEIATLPFYKQGAAAYTNLLFSKLNDILERGDNKDREKAFFALLKSYAYDVIPDENKKAAIALLLAFLGKIPVAAKHPEMPLSNKFDDIDQLLSDRLKQLLNRKIKEADFTTELINEMIASNQYSADAHDQFNPSRGHAQQLDSCLRRMGNHFLT